MIKLIATDMDGTLLDSNKKLPSELPQVLTALKEKGIRFVAASGRSYVTLYENFRPFSDWVDYICDNGAFVVLDGGISSVSVIPDETVNKLIHACASLKDVFLVLCGSHGTYHEFGFPQFDAEVNNYYINHKTVPKISEVKDDIFKIALFDKKGPENNSFPLLKAIFADTLSLQISDACWMDIMNPGIDKGAAILEIQKKLSISPEETMVFGDYFNDATMLQQAKYSFVMANAHPEMRRFGKYQAKSNDENGVIEAIREYVLKP